MKQSTIALAISLFALLAGCRESAVDKSPAAQVSDTVAVTTDTQPAPGGVKASVIKEKSRIDWVAGKVTRDHNGAFKNFDGSIEYVGGKPNRIAFDIDLNSIEADDPKLTGHLKTPDFFDVARYPKATFVSSSVTEAAVGAQPAGTTHTVKGVLDLHGVQKEVTIPVKTTVAADGVRTQSDFTINRQDWGISYKGMADDLIRDNVLIKLDLAFPPPPAA